MVHNWKTLGPASIPGTIFKDNVDILSKPLSLIINQSFTKDILPDFLKTAKVAPVHKKKESPK